MFTLLKNKLEDLPCAAWELTDTRETRWEFYFIGQKLDQNRSVQIHEAEVKVYVESEGGKYLGSASGTISPAASEAEIDETLERLVYQAGLVRNPYYTLTDREVCLPDGADSGTDIAAVSENYIRAFSSITDMASGDNISCRLNSYEIFVSEKKRHFLNSNGVEYSCSYPVTNLEVIVNAAEGDPKAGGHEVELYRLYDSGTCDEELLRGNILRLMSFASDRLRAVPAPKLGRGRVLLSTQDSREVYKYFSDRVHADYIVRKISEWNVGTQTVQDMTGDRLSLEAVSYLPNSSMNYPVDREGSLIRDRYLIRDGVVTANCGSRQFSQYLGIEDSSLVTNLRVSGGRYTEDEIRSGAAAGKGNPDEAFEYLEVVEFSSFSVDPMSGDIAGEVRLGYWCHGGEVDIVTGGSVSGSMAEAAKTMLFSKETVQYDNWEVPAVTLLEGLRITGA